MPPQSRVASIETLTHPDYPKILWVNVTSDDGLTGHGETSFGPETVEAFLHADVAAYLIGKDPDRLDRHWREINRIGITSRARGAEIRALSAVDMALWDLYAKRTKQPLYQVLGGLTRDRVRVYNTCAGYSYGVNRADSLRPGSMDYREDKPYEDQHAFLTDAGKLAEDLLSEGFTAMKIWPFDQFYEETDGQAISLPNLKKGVEPFEKIRKAVGDRIQIAAELHSLWNVPAAIRIAKALEEFDLMWIEDPIPMNNMDALADFRAKVNIPVTASETIATRESFREMFDRGATDIAMLDITWCGGLSEAKKIGTMAESYKLPVAPHDCTGPVTLMAGVHLAVNLPNGFIQETVRAFTAGWYPAIADRMPRIERGEAHAPADPGLGMALRKEFLGDEAAIIERSG